MSINIEKELEVIGEYSMPGIYGAPDAVAPKRNFPITPKENMLRLLRGEKPLWLPNQTDENNAIQTYLMPDAYARSFGGTDWFGIEWVWEPLTRAAMVKNGTRALSDITAWREEIKFPDLKAIDWQKDWDENYAHRWAEDRFTYFVIVNGLFERTADLTSFEDAFCALLEEPEELTAFYDKLVDWHIELIKIAHDVYHADMILFHDDMGTQRSTFFSPAIYEELFVPQYKKITKAAHDLGMHIALHSCGNISTIMPLIIEAGFDGWEGQDSANDKAAIMEQYGDKLAQFSMFVIPDNLPDEEAIERLHAMVDGLGAKGRYACRLRASDPRQYKLLAEELYRYSRLKFAQE